MSRRLSNDKAIHRHKPCGMRIYRGRPCAFCAAYTARASTRSTPQETRP